MAFPMLKPEIDILVLTLLGFKTFANFLKVSVSVSENLVSEKNLGFGFGKFGFQKSPGFGLRKFGLGKKSWLRFWKIEYRKKFQFRKVRSPKKILDFGFRFQKTWSQKRKNQNDKKETRPSKQCKSHLYCNLFCFVPIYKMEESKDCSFNIDILFRRRKKRGKILGEG